MGIGRNVEVWIFGAFLVLGLVACLSGPAERAAPAPVANAAVEGEMAAVVSEHVSGLRVDQPVDEGILVAGDLMEFEHLVVARGQFKFGHDFLVQPQGCYGRWVD